MAIKARDVKENVSMVDLLYNLGYSPLKKSGKERLYLSMLRDSDSTPSFSVDDKQGTWYDHGEGKGGNIIDFGLLYWKGSTFQEVLEKIVAVTNSGHQLIVHSPKLQAKIKIPDEPNYQIIKIQNIGQNNAITDYLQSRGVWEVGQGLLKEIYYYVEDEENNRRHFFAAGWQNENGSWEIRSTLNYKGCLGHKGISFIPGNDDSLHVFEGFFDYLSWLADNPFATNSVLVLNSLSFASGRKVAKAEALLIFRRTLTMM